MTKPLRNVENGRRHGMQPIRNGKLPITKHGEQPILSNGKPKNNAIDNGIKTLARAKARPIVRSTAKRSGHETGHGMQHTNPHNKHGHGPIVKSIAARMQREKSSTG